MAIMKKVGPVKWALAEKLLKEFSTYVYAGYLQTVPPVLKRYGHASWSWEAYNASVKDTGIDHIGSCYTMKSLVKAKHVCGIIRNDQGRYLELVICSEDDMSVSGKIISDREHSKLINARWENERIRQQIDNQDST